MLISLKFLRPFNAILRLWLSIVGSDCLWLQILTSTVLLLNIITYHKMES